MATVGSSTAHKNAFRKACQLGNVPLVRQMLEQGVSVDGSQEDGCTGLWLAAEAGQSQIVDMLCRRGAYLQAVKSDGQVTCLYVAAQNGHVQVVRVLLSHGADPNQAKDSGATPLFIASQQNNVDMVQVLLEAGAYPNTPTKTGVSPLMIAAYRGHPMVCRILVNAGADRHQVGGGRTALEWARANHTDDLVASILRSPAPSPRRSKPHASPSHTSPKPPTHPSPSPTFPPHKQKSKAPFNIPPPGSLSPRGGYSRNPGSSVHQDARSDPVYVSDASFGVTEPSKAYKMGEQSVATLLKMRHDPIDLDGAMRAVSRRGSHSPSARSTSPTTRRMKRSGSSASSVRPSAYGTEKQRPRDVYPTTPRDRTVIAEEQSATPPYIRVEKQRSQGFRDVMRREGLEKRVYRDPFGSPLERVARNEEADQQWDGLRQSLAAQEREMHFADPLVPRGGVHPSDPWGVHDTLEDLNRPRRRVVTASSIPMTLREPAIERLAAVMGSADPEALKTRVAELAAATARTQDTMSQSTASHEILLVQDDTHPKSPAQDTNVDELVHVRSISGGTRVSSAPAVPKDQDETALDGRVQDADADVISQASQALLARTASRRSKAESLAATLKSVGDGTAEAVPVRLEKQPTEPDAVQSAQ
ncbi:hypothetical protein DIPPA_56294 [Diplonema papillatum]|nr:hypothetical protein DIPPA_56294 [Diplonema papillatum]